MNSHAKSAYSVQININAKTIEVGVATRARLEEPMTAFWYPSQVPHASFASAVATLPNEPPPPEDGAVHGGDYYAHHGRDVHVCRACYLAGCDYWRSCEPLEMPCQNVLDW